MVNYVRMKNAKAQREFNTIFFRLFVFCKTKSVEVSCSWQLQRRKGVNMWRKSCRFEWADRGVQLFVNILIIIRLSEVIKRELWTPSFHRLLETFLSHYIKVADSQDIYRGKGDWVSLFYRNYIGFVEVSLSKERSLLMAFIVEPSLSADLENRVTKEKEITCAFWQHIRMF